MVPFYFQTFHYRRPILRLAVARRARIRCLRIGGSEDELIGLLVLLEELGVELVLVLSSLVLDSLDSLDDDKSGSQSCRHASSWYSCPGSITSACQRSSIAAESKPRSWSRSEATSMSSRVTIYCFAFQRATNAS